MKHVNTRKFKAVGGVFFKAYGFVAPRTTILFFALLFVALTAMNALAQPEPRVITLDHDTAIAWADSDGCFNYILLLIILWVVGLRLYRWTRRTDITDIHRK